MAGLFYFFGLLFFVYEFIAISKPMGYIRLIDGFRLKHKENKGKAEADKEKLTTNENIVVLTSFVYFVWMLMGALMASQGAGFAILFVFGITMNWLKRIAPTVLPYRLLMHYIDALTSLIIVGYLIVNHFQHIDLIALDYKSVINLLMGN